jgi:L-fuculose-phosphate aldolase
MPSREDIARQIVDVCHRLYERHLVTATDGNVSARLADGRFLVTPSGVAKGRVGEKDLVEVGLDGTPLEPGLRATSELGMHLFIYRKRPDVSAVVHAHPPYASGFAAARKQLDARVFPELVIGLGEVPLAPYGTPSTEEVASSIAPYIETARAVLLANHGVVTMGASLEEAFTAMEKVEQAAHVLLVAEMLGGARPLSGHDLERLGRLKDEPSTGQVKRSARRRGRRQR